MISLTWILYLALFLFCLGLFLLLTRRNAVMALLGIELILNSANLNFIVFSRMDYPALQGQMTALFVMVLAAAEVAVALAIIILVFKRYKTIALDEIDELKD